MDIRISTSNQTLDKQWEAFKSYEKENSVKFDAIFEDKQSGKDLTEVNMKR
ncbi:MAG: recombinase family protein [Firmicutes bacterium]|nr:recombinase family protein [Bacillota bacterium]